MFGENCPVATPTPEDSDISFSEQSGTPTKSRIHHFGESPQKFSAPKRMRMGKFLQGKFVIRIQTQSWAQSHALILSHRVSLALN